MYRYWTNGLGKISLLSSSPKYDTDFYTTQWGFPNCRRSEITIEQLAGVTKVVNDILVYSRPANCCHEQVFPIFERCYKYATTLTPKEFVLGKNEVKYVRGQISHNGIRGDCKFAAVHKFLMPPKVTQPRSAIGFVNQMPELTLNGAHTTEPLCPPRLTKVFKTKVFGVVEEHRHDFRGTHPPFKRL